MGEYMPLIFIAADSEGNILTASTTDPLSINYAKNDEMPNFQYQFELSWEQIDELWRYKVVDGVLVIK